MSASFKLNLEESVAHFTNVRQAHMIEIVSHATDNYRSSDGRSDFAVQYLNFFTIVETLLAK